MFKGNVEPWQPLPNVTQDRERLSLDPVRTTNVSNSSFMPSVAIVEALHNWTHSFQARVDTCMAAKVFKRHRGTTAWSQKP